MHTLLQNEFDLAVQSFTCRIQKVFGALYVMLKHVGPAWAPGPWNVHSEPVRLKKSSTIAANGSSPTRKPPESGSDSVKRRERSPVPSTRQSQCQGLFSGHAEVPGCSVIRSRGMHVSPHLICKLNAIVFRSGKKEDNGSHSNRVCASKRRGPGCGERVNAAYWCAISLETV